MDDLDALLCQMTLPQRMALGQAISAIMMAEKIKAEARAMPGEVAFTRPVADMFKKEAKP